MEMHKFLRYLPVVIVFAAHSTFAQLLIGPTAGGNISWVSYEDNAYKDAYETGHVYGFHAGANISFRVHKQFFLHTSLLYSQKGKTLEGRVDKQMKDRVRHSYLELPLLYTVEFKSIIGRDKVYKWYLGAGPNVSYWLGGKGTIQNSELQEVNIDKLAYKVVFGKPESEVRQNELNVAEANRVQLGLNFSAGVVFEPLPSHILMLMLRYELGHSFLSKEGYGTFSRIAEYRDNLLVRNQGVRISLSYLLDTNIDQRKRGKSTNKNSNKRKR